MPRLTTITRRAFGVWVLMLGSGGVPVPALAGPVDQLPPGCWYEAPNSELQSAFPPRPWPPGISGPAGVMAWSGAAYDTKRERLIVWGGGEPDYAGNEVYAFDVRSLRWQRLDSPTRANLIRHDAARYYDGRPSARHTFNSIQYAARVDRFFSLGFASAFGRNAVSGDTVDAYNFAAPAGQRWAARKIKPSNGGAFGAFSAYAPDTGKLYHHGVSTGASLAAYDPKTNAWKAFFPGSYAPEASMTAAIHPGLDILVATGGRAAEVAVWDLTNPREPDLKLTSGKRALEAVQAPGFVYDPHSDRFVGWGGGANVYTLDPYHWTWERVEPATANKVNPGEAHPSGTYGRFRYIPSNRAFILVNAADKNVFFYKLPAADGSPSSSCPAKSVEQGGGGAGGATNNGAGSGGALDGVSLLGLLLMLIALRGSSRRG